MDWLTAKGQVQRARDKRSKPFANNTRINKREDNVYALTLHETDVVTFFPDGRILLSTGGWFTVTTKDRLNYVEGLNVYTEKGIWWVQPGIRLDNGSWRYWNHDSSETSALLPRVRFFDGIIFQEQNGKMTCLNPLPQQEQDERDERAREIKRKISRFVKLAEEKLIEGLPMPSGGDCWYCAMQTNSGQTLGDVHEDDHHLEDHMDEGYVVPSLLVNALRERGMKDAGIYMTLGMNPAEGTMGGNRSMPDSMKRSLSRYLKTRLIPDEHDSTPMRAASRETGLQTG